MRNVRSGPPRVLVAVLLMLVARAWAAAPPGAPQIALDAQQQQRIAALACPAGETTGLDQLETRTPRAPSRTLEVTARCRPHGVEARLPVARQSLCSNAAGRWQCAPAQDVMVMTLPEAPALAVVAQGVAPDVAVQAVLEATRHTVPPFHKPGRWMLQGTCAVSQAPVADFAGATEYAIRCTPGTVYLVRACHRGSCRHYIARGEENR